MYLASAPVLAMAARLGSERDWPSPQELRKGVLAALRQMVDRCRAAGIPDGEISEARYAIVAFVDDRILRSNWPGRAEWMSQPLQLQLFREYAAGENFFARLGALLRKKETPIALETYYLCLALGFMGAAPGKGSERAESYLEVVRARLPQPSPDALCRHALPSDRRPLKVIRRPRLALSLAVGCFAVVLVGLALLQWSLSAMIRRAEHHLQVSVSHPAALGEGT
jgi:type VI secretion system protein ImpK